MSGLKSRNKGNRGEYAARDHLRAHGYTVDRIPASGAAQGFKGDLRIKYANKEIIVEVKVRQKEFTRLYEALGKLPPSVAGYCGGAVLSYYPRDIVTGTTLVAPITVDAGLGRLLKKCLSLRANSDILAVKDDRRPFIYVTWLEDSLDAGAGNA